MRTLVSIQYLRGIAAMMVVFEHVRVQIDAYAPYLAWQSGIAGVDVFFVVSGVIMMITTTGASFREFIVRRAVRVVPLYWLFTLLVCFVWLLAPDRLNSTVVSLDTLARSLLFIPHYNLGHPGEITPILVPGWTLNYEMFFYLVFALLIGMAPGRRVLAAAGVFSALVAAGVLIGGDAGPVVRTYTDSVMLEFVAGMAIGYAYLRRASVTPALSRSFIAVGFALFAGDVMLGDGMPRVLALGVAAALVVLGSVQLDMAGGVGRHKVLLVLGDASYSIYLSHIPVLGALRVVWRELGLVGDGAWSACAFAAAGMATAAVVGCIIYRLVERPMLRAWHRRLEERRSDAPVGPAKAVGA